MAIKCGFFNSSTEDPRLYNSEDFGHMFDGVITDGVYMACLDHFIHNKDEKHLLDDEGTSIVVGTGRCWFNHTWLLNDAPISFPIHAADPLQYRYDYIVVDVDFLARKSTIKYIETFVDNPNLVHSKTETHECHPLFRIFVDAKQTKFTEADVTNYIGTSVCPYVTGTVSHEGIVTADELLREWQAGYENQMNENEVTFNASEATRTEEFNTWFEGLQVSLEGDVAASLASRIGVLENNDVHQDQNISELRANDLSVRPVSNGGTGASTKAEALNNLGIVIGESVAPAHGDPGTIYIQML